MSEPAPGPSIIALWLPRADEHALAASLGMVGEDPSRVRAFVEGAAAECRRLYPDAEVKVGRWHVWRVVRALHRTGQQNTPEGRSVAYVHLATDNEA